MNRMRKNKIKKQITFLATGDLSPRAKIDIENIIKGDKCLEKELSGFKKIIKDVAALKADNPRRSFEQRIKQSVILSLEKPSNRRAKILFPAIFASAAALILLALIIFIPQDTKIQEAEVWLAQNLNSVETLNGYSDIHLESLAASELDHFDTQLQKVIDTELKDAKQISETDAYLEWNTVFHGLLSEKNTNTSKKISEEL